MDEKNSLISTICKKYDCNPNDCRIVGKGYTSTILKMSDKLCIKITSNKTCTEIPLSIRNSDNLCIPMETYVSTSGKYYGYVQQYLGSISLQDYIKNKILCSEKDTAYIIYDVLKGLELLHSNNYVHRDFYPGNIMVYNQNGKFGVSIIDFDEMQKMHATTKPCFRYNGYHAPEIVFYNETYDGKSEVFAVGIIMWELLMGNCSFGGYNFFGAVIENSWDKYKQRSNYYHSRVLIALKTLKDSIKCIEKLSADCVDLLLELLAEDRNDRITASDALNHAFFSFIRNERL